MAWHLRDSQFAGIDLEQAQIDTGRALIDELGLCNIEVAAGRYRSRWVTTSAPSTT